MALSQQDVDALNGSRASDYTTKDGALESLISSGVVKHTSGTQGYDSDGNITYGQDSYALSDGTEVADNGHGITPMQTAPGQQRSGVGWESAYNAYGIYDAHTGHTQYYNPDQVQWTNKGFDPGNAAYQSASAWFPPTDDGGFGSLLPMVGSAIGSIWGPWGAAAGNFIGSKIAGADTGDALKGAALTYAGGELAGGGETPVTTAPTTASFGDVVSQSAANAFSPKTLAVSAGLNAAGQYASTGKVNFGDVAKGTLAGAVGGTVGGVVGAETGVPVFGKVAGGLTTGAINNAVRGSPASVSGSTAVAPGTTPPGGNGLPTFSDMPSFSTVVPQFKSLFDRTWTPQRG